MKVIKNKLLLVISGLFMITNFSCSDGSGENKDTETNLDSDTETTANTDEETGSDTNAESGTDTDSGVFTDMTGLEIAADMAPGINLWNTLDAYGSWVSGLATETAWGSPVTTKEMVTEMKNRGFKTLRIPVTWFQHLGDAPDYTIDVEWLDRVEEVVNYALDNGMYAIVNIHHDEESPDNEGSWLMPTYAKQAEVTDELEKVWMQIASRFKDYDYHLIMETMNEPREIGSATEWSGGSLEHREVVNALNLAAVNKIRSTGGNNAERFIMIPQVGANGAALNDIVIPNDDKRIIVSVHNYDPYYFTIASKDDPNAVSTWGTSAEQAALEAAIKSYYDRFAAKGQAIIIGEWGASDRNNYDERVVYYKFFANTCAKYQITPIAWIYSFNRETLEWEYPLLEDAMLDAFSN